MLRIHLLSQNRFTISTAPSDGGRPLLSALQTFPPHCGGIFLVGEAISYSSNLTCLPLQWRGRGTAERRWMRCTKKYSNFTVVWLILYGGIFDVICRVDSQIDRCKSDMSVKKRAIRDLPLQNNQIHIDILAKRTTKGRPYKLNLFIELKN